MKPRVQATINNRTTLFRCDQETLQLLKQIFCYQVPGYYHTWQYQTGTWDGYTNLLRNRRVATGLFLALKDKVQECCDLHVDDQREGLRLRPFAANQRDRPYQIKGVEACRNSISGGLLLCATQTGKTHIAARFTQHVNEHVLFLTHELTLVQQAKTTFERVTSEKIGIAGGGQFDPQRITVATVQTLIRQTKQPAAKFRQLFNTVTVVLVDEVHLMLNDSTKRVIQACAPKAVFGLTASLDLDKPEIAYPAYALTGPVLYRYNIKQGVDEGYLTPGIIVVLKVDKLTNKSTNNETPTEAYNRIVVQNEQRTAAVCHLVMEGLRRKHRIVVFVQRYAHVSALQETFRAVGLPCAVLSGQLKKGEQRVALCSAFERGEQPVLLVTAVGTHGIVLNTLTVTIDATGMRSSHFTIQKYGRGAARVVGKAGKIHFDLSDTTGSYQKNATERRKVLRRLGSKVLITRWEKVTGNVTKLYDIAEQQLNKEKN